MRTKDDSLIAHLEELRAILIRCFVALGVFLVPMFFVAPYCIDFLIRMMLGDNVVHLNFFSPMEVFVLELKMAFVLDLLICFPYISIQIWKFIVPGLYENERRFVRSVVLSSACLFIFGVVFCLCFILPMVVNFGLSFENARIQAVFGIENIVSLSLWLSIIFGLMFQFPLITYALIRFRLVRYENVRAQRPYVFVGILLLSALLTPPDVISQILLTIPTCFLFEIGLFFARPKGN